MATLESLERQLNKARNELQNIRKEIQAVKHIHLKDVQKIRSALENISKYAHGGDTLEKCTSDVTVLGKTPIVKNYDSTENPDSKTEYDTEYRKTDALNGTPIGHVYSIFKHKNGTPRQANVCVASKAVVELRKDLFTNPEHSLDGLEAYSHLWIIYIFHKNNAGTYTKAKVAPPRLNGARVGLFSTRCPYRPNPVGLSLVKIDSIQGARIHISGVDILDGTPVLDIKPYIPEYDMARELAMHPTHSNMGNESSTSDPCSPLITDDTIVDSSAATGAISAEIPSDPALCETNCPKSTEDIMPSLKTNTETTSAKPSQEDDENSTMHEDSTSSVRSASWIKAPPIRELTVLFSRRSEDDLDALTRNGCLGKFTNQNEVKSAIESILRADPRSTYRREKCKDRLYHFALDTLHMTCWFDDDIAEVLRIKVSS